MTLSLQNSQKSRHVDAAVLPSRNSLEQGNGKSRLLCQAPEIALAVRVARVLAEDDTLALMCLNREGEKTAAPEHAPDLTKNFVERRQIDEHVGRHDEVGRPVRLHFHEIEELALVKPVVEAGFSGECEHAWREVDTVNRGVGARKGSTHEPGAAAEVEHALGPRGRAIGRIGPPHGSAQKLGPAIIEVLDEVLVERAGVIVEKGADVARADGFLQGQRSQSGEVDA